MMISALGTVTRQILPTRCAIGRSRVSHRLASMSPQSGSGRAKRYSRRGGSDMLALMAWPRMGLKYRHGCVVGIVVLLVYFTAVVSIILTTYLPHFKTKTCQFLTLSRSKI